jgi:hypothetical protein
MIYVDDLQKTAPHRTLDINEYVTITVVYIQWHFN